MLYFEGRIRHEALDLQVMTEALAAAGHAGGAGLSAGPAARSLLRWLRRVATALVAVALLLPALARAGQPPAGELDVPAFLATLDDLAGRVEAARSPADVATLTRDLPAAWTVRAGTERFSVAAAPVADVLATADDADMARGPRPRASPVSPRCATKPHRWPSPVRRRRRICASRWPRSWRRRNSAAGSATPACWPSPIGSRRWLRSWLPDFQRTTGTVTPILRYASWIVAAIAFVLLAWLTWRLLRGVSRDAAVRPAISRGGEPIDAQAWAARARAAAADGHAREAVRCAYHAVLHRLDEDGAWTIAEDRTPREYLRLLPAADRRRPAVSFVARLFEGTWYGGAEPGLDEARPPCTTSAISPTRTRSVPVVRNIIPRRGIPPRRVAPRSDPPGILTRRALRSGRCARALCHDPLGQDTRCDVQADPAISSSSSSRPR